MSDAVRMVYPDLYNYDLSSLTRAREEEGAVVESVSRALASLVERLGWERVVVVVVSSGGQEHHRYRHHPG